MKYLYETLYETFYSCFSPHVNVTLEKRNYCKDHHCYSVTLLQCHSVTVSHCYNLKLLQYTLAFNNIIIMLKPVLQNPSYKTRLTKPVLQNPSYKLLDGPFPCIQYYIPEPGHVAC